MRLFRRKAGKTVFELQGDVATATHARYAGAKEFPRIELMFKVRGSDPVTGEHFDELRIELDVYEATKLSNQLLVSLNAALPEKPRGPWRTAYGE